MPNHTFDRRTLLTGAGVGLAALSTGGLAGCGSTAAEQNTAQANAGVTLPTFVAYQGLQPDLPENENGVLRGFFDFPADPPTSVPEVPGDGLTITAMTRIYSALPPGPDGNSYWAGLNERLGADLRVQMVPDADYSQKFATTIAGNDLPDVVSMVVGPDFPRLLDARFTPLDEHLAGDAVLDYPNLANIPTSSWQATVFNGKIYGVPVPRGAIRFYPYIRQDLFESAGASTAPTSFEELLETAEALTDPGERRWAFGLSGQLLAMLKVIDQAPNVWAEEGGRLTHVNESEQYKQVVDDMITLWKAGVIHPDGFSTAFPFKQYFDAGTVAIQFDGYVGWSGYIRGATDPDFQLGLMPLPRRDGGGLAAWHTGPPSFNPSPLAAIRTQDDPERTRAILRVLNWLAAPFGTQEYLYREFGEQGVDHTVEDGNPILTEQGRVNTGLPTDYLAAGPPVLYEPGRAEEVEIQHAYQTEALAETVDDPTLGLFSNTEASQGASAERTFADGVNAIILGRRPFADLDQLVTDWKAEAGDAMRAEYEEQLQTG